MISHHCSRTATSSSRSRVAKLVVNAFSQQQNYVKKNTFFFSTKNTPTTPSTAFTSTPYHGSATRNNIFGLTRRIHNEQTKRWMSDGTAEKTEEEKAAIKAAREARK